MRISLEKHYVDRIIRRGNIFYQITWTCWPFFTERRFSVSCGKRKETPLRIDHQRLYLLDLVNR